jgi:hypothetical protein
MALVATWVVQREVIAPKWVALGWLAYSLGRILWVLWVEEWCWSVRWRWRAWRWRVHDRRRMRRYERELQRSVNAELRKRGLIR